MSSPFHSIPVIEPAGWFHAGRPAVFLLLSGLTSTVFLPAVAWTQTGAPVVPVERMMIDDPFAGSVAEAAQRFDLPAAWIRMVIAVESNGDPHARSPKGAMGLMQIMPATWADLRGRYGLGPDPFEPRANILAGTAYLREMFDRYGSPGFFAAYHAGPERYEDHLATGRPLPAETRAYIAMLVPMVGGGQEIGRPAYPRDWRGAPLFVAVKRDGGREAMADPEQGDDRLAPSSESPLNGTPVASALFVGRWRSAVPTHGRSSSDHPGSDPSADAEP